MPLRAPTACKFQLAAAVTTIAYIAVVYLISYMVFTPSDANSVSGVQSRYFIPILPLVAITLGSLASRGFSERLTATLAIASSVLSGGASVEAILRTDCFTAKPLPVDEYPFILRVTRFKILAVCLRPSVSRAGRAGLGTFAACACSFPALADDRIRASIRGAHGNACGWEAREAERSQRSTSPAGRAGIIAVYR